jgi:lipoprotein signal peptidase
MREVAVAAIAFFLLDYASKDLVERRTADGVLSFGSHIRVWRIVHAKASYTKLCDRLLLLTLWLLACFSVLLLHRWGNSFQSNLSQWGLGAALGGSGGNLCDILRHKGVIDFIDLGWWPAFNLADVAILAGLAAAFLG